MKISGINRFLKKLKQNQDHMIQKFKPKQKISQYSDTESNFNLSKGSRVKVRSLIEFDNIKLDFYYIGFIIDINERYVIPSIKSSYKLEYKVRIEYKNIENWVDAKDIIPYSLEDEREEKLNKLLND